MSRQNPETSNEAYRSLDPRQLNDTYRQILSALDAIGRGTFEDVAAWLKCNPSKIWKRMSELSKMELIYRPGTKKVLKSGRQGYEWMRTNPSKTEVQAKEVVYKATEKTAADFASDLINSATQPIYIPGKLF